MIVKHAVLVLLFVSMFFCAFSADIPYVKYNWLPERSNYPVEPKDSSEAIVILKNVQRVEYAYSEDGNNLFIFETTHQIIRVKTDDAIEAYNKVYIPMQGVSDIVEIKSRALSPIGKAVLLDKNNIKEIKGEKEGGGYKIFAVEGVEKGGEIEFLYTLKKEVVFFGREYLQFGVPVKSTEFLLITPLNLVFECKGYNGLPEVSDSVSLEKRFQYLQLPEMSALTGEAFSYVPSNRQRIEYKLAYNLASGSKKRLLTWQDAADRIFSNIHTFAKDEEKAAAKFVKSAKIKTSWGEKEKIAHVERLIKNRIDLQEGYSEEYYNVNSILTNKYGNSRGIVRVFASVFKAMGLEYQIVLTSERSQVLFDPEFDSWNYLENYMFYFPKLGLYLAPSRFEYHLGMVPSLWTLNYGLFIRILSDGKDEFPKGEVKYIEPSPASKSFDNLVLDVELRPEEGDAKLSIKRVLGGHNSVGLLDVFAILSPDKKKEFIQDVIRRSAPDAVFSKESAVDVKPENITSDSPFEMNAEVTSSALFEKAGNNYLFKIGESIGAQTELYQEKKRMTDVENDFNRQYDRTLRFTVPDGYSIKNPDDLRFDVTYKPDGKDVYGFVSTYTLEGNKLEVKIFEYYNEIRSPKNDFEAFRAVINAAADFNKVTLVLEKK